MPGNPHASHATSIREVLDCGCAAQWSRRFRARTTESNCSVPSFASQCG